MRYAYGTLRNRGAFATSADAALRNILVARSGGGYVGRGYLMTKLILTIYIYYFTIGTTCDFEKNSVKRKFSCLRASHAATTKPLALVREYIL